MKKIIMLFFPIFLIAAAPNIPQKQTAALVEFTDANFKKTVLKKKGVTVIEFWAEWCGPCRLVEPVITELAKDYGKKVTVGKLNVDLEPKITKKYNIRSIPTILIFKDGEVVDKYVGVLTKKDLEEKIEVLL
ncbi:MAG: thioredoxin [Saprospiraceae bacterium]